MKSLKYFLELCFLLVILSCSKNDSNTNFEKETSAPIINSLTSNKSQIFYGGEDYTEITCNASGGNLSYKWEVDLGDIIPLNSSHSKIKYAGSACCVGEKTIKCTVTNSLGSDSKTIQITIIETTTKPEIINIIPDKSSLNQELEESTLVTCFAKGGKLSYNWNSTLGAISYPNADSSIIKFSALKNQKGIAKLKCLVTNEKGSVSDSTEITFY